MQMIGTLVGSLLNYVLTISITTSQRDILLSIQGTHIWSGAVSLPSQQQYKDFILLCRSGPTIIQYSGRNLGRPRKPHVFLGEYVSMGAARSGNRIRGASSNLRLAPLLPQGRFQLPQRINYLMAHWMARHRHQFADHDFLRCGFLESILASQIQG